MIWNDSKIKKWANSGGVTPYDETLVKPASLDLRLGDKIRFPLRKWATKSCAPVTMQTLPSELWDDEIVITSAGIVIPSGCAVLCCSLEYIKMPPDASGTLMSRSGTGRRLFEHLHAGFFEPDFHGQATYEFVNDGPWDMRLFVGDALVQLKLEQMIDAPETSYLLTGKYNGQVGATPHRAERGVIGGNGDNR